MPEIRVPGEPIEVLGRVRRDELQAGALADAAERLHREERYVVAPRPERPAKTDEWVHVTHRTDRRQEETPRLACAIRWHRVAR